MFSVSLCRPRHIAIASLFVIASLRLSQRTLPLAASASMAARAATSPATAERYGEIPRLYVEALNDRSVILPVQRAMQALAPGFAV